MLARYLEAISGKGPGLAGSALRQHVVAIGVGRRLARGADFRTARKPGNASHPACEAARKV